MKAKTLALAIHKAFGASFDLSNQDGPSLKVCTSAATVTMSMSPRRKMGGLETLKVELIDPMPRK